MSPGQTLGFQGLPDVLACLLQLFAMALVFGLQLGNTLLEFGFSLTMRFGRLLFQGLDLGFHLLLARLESRPDTILRGLELSLDVIDPDLTNNSSEQATRYIIVFPLILHILPLLTRSQ